MPQLEAQLSHEPTVEVLTLPETAAYLRVPEMAVLELVERGVLPAQRIGNEWRLLKRAVVGWLLGPQLSRELWMLSPPWDLEHPFWEELFQTLERRILSQRPVSAAPSSRAGSKAAVLDHFGVFQSDEDLTEQLAGIHNRRGAAGG